MIEADNQVSHDQQNSDYYSKKPEINSIHFAWTMLHLFSLVLNFEDAVKLSSNHHGHNEM